MTHKYLSQIRTIPNYYEDQSAVAKTMRKASYSLKSATSYLIKNKKTRIVSSILAIYLVITSGFAVTFINVNNSASASNFAQDNALSIEMHKPIINANNIEVDLKLNNKSNEIASNFNLNLQSSFNNVQWQTALDNENKTIAFSSNDLLLITSINAGQSQKYTIKGKITNPNISNIALMTAAKYNSNNISKEINSPKLFINIK